MPYSPLKSRWPLNLIDIFNVHMIIDVRFIFHSGGGQQISGVVINTPRSCWSFRWHWHWLVMVVDMIRWWHWTHVGGGHRASIWTISSAPIAPVKSRPQWWQTTCIKSRQTEHAAGAIWCTRRTIQWTWRIYPFLFLTAITEPNSYDFLVHVKLFGQWWDFFTCGFWID